MFTLIEELCLGKVVLEFYLLFSGHKISLVLTLFENELVHLLLKSLEKGDLEDICGRHVLSVDPCIAYNRREICRVFHSIVLIGYFLLTLELFRKREPCRKVPKRLVQQEMQPDRMAPLPTYEINYVELLLRILCPKHYVFSVPAKTLGFFPFPAYVVYDQVTQIGPVEEVGDDHFEFLVRATRGKCFVALAGLQVVESVCEESA